MNLTPDRRQSLMIAFVPTKPKTTLEGSSDASRAALRLLRAVPFCVYRCQMEYTVMV